MLKYQIFNLNINQQIKAQQTKLEPVALHNFQGQVKMLDFFFQDNLCFLKDHVKIK